MSVDAGLLVGALTATTALAASWLTAWGTSRAALVQARATATFDAAREQRERRRSTYREMVNQAHAFSEVLWRVGDAGDQGSRDEALEQVHSDAGRALNALTRATREVLLDGPAEVADAAERLRTLALQTQRRLRALIGTPVSDPGPRQVYDEAYVHFREAYLRFIELARNALEAA